MTPAGFTIILVCHLSYSGANSIGHGARAPIFTNSWERGGGTRPHTRAFFAPGPNWGTSVSQITWPHTITEGPCPRHGTGHGSMPLLLQIAGHVEQRGANKKLTKGYCLPRKRSPKWLIVTVEP